MFPKKNKEMDCPYCDQGFSLDNNLVEKEYLIKEFGQESFMLRYAGMIKSTCLLCKQMFFTKQ